MFRDARALDRQRTAASFQAALQRYTREAEKWFDGSVNSIDRRLGSCEKLLHSVRATVARLSATDSHRYLRAAEELESDRRALHALREDMLTGGADRADGADGGAVGRPADAYSQTTGPAPGHRPSRPRHAPGADAAVTAKLNGTDRRWVTLESAKFVAAHRDVLDDSSELATRATHHAQVKTSTFTRERSAAVTRAFVATVADLGCQAHVPIMVRTAAVDVSFDPQALYL
jgi:hypothetical protein